MPSVVDLTVPDLGEFHDVPVIEVLVKPGDRVEKDAPLVTLESEKATMEVPASAAGVVRDIAVKIGDRVSSGSVVAHVEAVETSAVPGNAQAQAQAPAQAPPPHQETTAPQIERATLDLVVPDIGDFHDVPVIEVLVKAGERVEKEATLVTLESEKASMDVPAEAAGVVQEVRVRVGDRVSKGSVLATLAGDEPPAVRGPQASASAPAPQAPPAVAAAVSPAVPSRDGGATTAPVPATLVHASPAIRRFARELGVDLSRVVGSGPNGRITRDDVQAYVKRSLASPVAQAAQPTAALGLAALPKVDFAQFGPIERKRLSRIKRISGPNLHRNWVMIPHVTQNDDADITALEEFRNRLNTEQKDVKITLLAFLMKALVAALRRYPEFNASLDGDELVLKNYYHIGFAADTPDGLIVPVVRDVERKGVLELARETSELASAARASKLSMRDMQGGTFTISSLGGIGGTYFTPIINAPEVAILGVCRAATRPVWDGAAFEPRLMLPLSLSYDHRVIDGAAAARFTVFFAGVLKDMRRTLL